MIWRVLLGIFGVDVGLGLTTLGTLSTMDGFAFAWPAAVVRFGALIGTWSILGAIRPAKVRFVPPAAFVSLHFHIWLFTFVGEWARNV